MSSGGKTKYEREKEREIRKEDERELIKDTDETV